jgi:hypothetical protein
VRTFRLPNEHRVVKVVRAGNSDWAAPPVLTPGKLAVYRPQRYNPRLRTPIVGERAFQNLELASGWGMP